LVRPVFFVVLCAVAFAIAAAVPPRMPQTTGILATAASLILTWIFIRWDRISPADVGVGLTRWSVPRFAAGVAIGLLLVTAWAAVVVGLHSPRLPPNEWAVTYVLLAAREELSFRGYPLRRLLQRFGYWPAQFVIALLFGLEHKIAGWTWTQAFAGAAAGSLLFGAASIASQGLAIPIGMHAAWNFGASALGPPAPSPASTLGFAILCVLCALVVNYSFRHGQVGTDHPGGGRPRSGDHEPG